MTEREEFEKWYAESAFNFVRDPIGSRDCGLQWKAWQVCAELKDKRIKELEAKLRTAREDALEEAAGICIFKAHIHEVSAENSNHHEEISEMRSIAWKFKIAAQEIRSLKKKSK